VQNSRSGQGDDSEQDNPSLSKVIERNIRTIIQLRLKSDRERNIQGRVADYVTAYAGSMAFVHVHVAWFAIWVLLNTGRFGVHPFDPFPYGLLTMVVSLEAIFLSALVLITQNRLSEESEHRADLHLHVGLLAEHELTRVLQMLGAFVSGEDWMERGVQETGTRIGMYATKEGTPQSMAERLRDVGDRAPSVNWARLRVAYPTAMSKTSRTRTGSSAMRSSAGRTPSLSTRWSGRP